MRKGLRTLCLGVLAAVTAVSSAQKDVTNEYLLNADIEKGLIGWELEFAYADNANIWNKQTKGEEKAAGYYGFNNLAIENWRGSGNLTDGAIYQSLKGLPNGTYVFGAYAMATNHSWTPILTISRVYQSLLTRSQSALLPTVLRVWARSGLTPRSSTLQPSLPTVL